MGLRILRCGKAMEKMPHAQPIPHSTAAPQFIGSSVPRRPLFIWSQKVTPIRSDRPSWIPTEIGMGPYPAESATGPIEKMPHPGRWLYQASYRVERQTGSSCVRHLASFFTSGSDLERRPALLENSTGRECLVRLSHNTAGRDINITSFQYWPGVHPLSVVLETTWTAMRRSCLNILGAYSWCDCRATLHLYHLLLPPFVCDNS